jgi:hypothetical protein
MKTIVKISVLTFLFIAGSSECFALREIAPLTKEEAKGMGIEVRAKAAGLDAVWLELEFKPEGKLKEFTHVELKMAEGRSRSWFPRYCGRRGRARGASSSR